MLAMIALLETRKSRANRGHKPAVVERPAQVDYPIRVLVAGLLSFLIVGVDQVRAAAYCDEWAHAVRDHDQVRAIPVPLDDSEGLSVAPMQHGVTSGIGCGAHQVKDVVGIRHDYQRTLLGRGRLALGSFRVRPSEVVVVDAD